MANAVKRFFNCLQYKYLIHFDKRIKYQRKHVLQIPIIIINYNQLESLKKLVSFLIERQFQNIIIVDNSSTYIPLKNYYKAIRNQVTIEMMDKNYGHMVFFQNQSLLEKYAKGYYVLTDPDIIPNANLPIDFMDTLINKLDRYQYKIVKVGFALDLETIPEEYPLKENVLMWEQKYWTDLVEKDTYRAHIDTTFALYKPYYPNKFYVKENEFFKAIRIAGNFTCKHMGWYINPKELSSEQIFYTQTSNSSASWKFDEAGNLDSTYEY